MAEQYYSQQNFSGGLSDSDVYGLTGSFADAVGIDIHSTPRILKVSQALKKETTAAGGFTGIEDFCKFSINCTDGNSYWFGDTGKIYKRTSAGVWSKVHTDTQGAVIGAREFNAYIYYASATKLGRQSVANAASESPWSSQNDSWATLDTATYHPMITQGLYLFIGNDRKIATVDDTGTFTATGTPDVVYQSLPPNYTITTMSPFGIDFLVGTKITSTYGSARVFRWDYSQASWLTDDDIPGEIGVNVFIPYDNFAFIQAGNQGRFWFYDGSSLEKVKRIKGDYANKTMAVHPDSVCSFNGLSMIGVSNLSSNPCNQGVYSIGQYDRNYPYALMLEYVISQNKLTSIEIGSIKAIGSNLLVAWKDGTTYGVDIIDWANKYTGAYVKTLALGGDRATSKTFLEYLIGYKQKPASTDITLSYFPNYGTSDTAIALDDFSTYNKLFTQYKIEAALIQLKLAFTVSGNDAPEIDLVYTKWNARETL